MVPSRRDRLRIGDVVEIKTRRGRAYAQVSHRSRGGMPLLRILPGYFDKRPADIDRLVAEPTRYYVSLLTDELSGLSSYEHIGADEVPQHARRFRPVILTAVLDRVRTMSWQVWDGVDEWQTSTPIIAGRRAPELARHSPGSVIRELEQDLDPPSGEDFLAEHPMQFGGRTGSRNEAPSLGGSTSHYLYFRGRDDAVRAMKTLESEWPSVQLRDTPSNSKWLVLVRTEAAGADDVDTAATRLEVIAREFGGDYDGWEVGVAAARRQ